MCNVYESYGLFMKESSVLPFGVWRVERFTRVQFFKKIRVILNKYTPDTKKQIRSRIFLRKYEIYLVVQILVKCRKSAHKMCIS